MNTSAMNDGRGAPQVPEEVPPHLAPELETPEPPISAAEIAGFDVDEAEREAAAALASGEVVPPHHDLLGFYDRLRPRVLDTVERRGGQPPAGGGIALLLVVPDIFILLVRLMLDKNVPRRARLLIGGAIAYFISPIDLLPELILGPIG